METNKKYCKKKTSWFGTEEIITFKQAGIDEQGNSKASVLRDCTGRIITFDQEGRQTGRFPKEAAE